MAFIIPDVSMPGSAAVVLQPVKTVKASSAVTSSSWRYRRRFLDARRDLSDLFLHILDLLHGLLGLLQLCGFLLQLGLLFPVLLLGSAEQKQQKPHKRGSRAHKRLFYRARLNSQPKKKSPAQGRYYSQDYEGVVHFPS